MPTPTLTRPGNQAAVQASALLRGERARIRRRVIIGDLTVPQLLEACPRVMHGMRVFEVVELAWPGSNQRSGGGRRRHLELLAVAAAQAQVNLFREVQRLSPRQRDWLIAWLAAHPYRPRGGPRPRS